MCCEATHRPSPILSSQILPLKNPFVVLLPAAQALDKTQVTLRGSRAGILPKQKKKLYNNSRNSTVLSSYSHHSLPAFFATTTTPASLSPPIPICFHIAFLAFCSSRKSQLAVSLSNAFPFCQDNPPRPTRVTAVHPSEPSPTSPRLRHLAAPRIRRQQCPHILLPPLRL